MSQDIENKKNEINSEKATIGQNYVYHNPAPKINNQEQFPIIASGIVYPYNQNVIPLNDLKEIHDGGFNLALKFLANISYVNTSLENAIGTGVKLFPSCGEFYSDEKGIKSVQDINELAGINLKDEPYYSELTDASGIDKNCTFQCIRKASLKVQYDDLINQILSQRLNCLVYINLPAYGGDSFYKNAPGDTSKDRYLNYLSFYQDNYLPSFFSYDLYPIWEYTKLLYYGLKPNPSEQEGEIKVDDNFYENLELYMSLSRNTYNRDNKNVPFWAFCQGISYMRLEEAQFKPIALEQYLRFEAFNALAYGAQGIVYWRYAMDSTNSGESYFSALLDRRGKRTASWYYARKVNQEIQLYKEVFVNSQCIDVKRSAGETFRSTNTNFLYNVTVTVDSSGYMVFSLIQNGNNRFLVVVNSEPLKYQKIHLRNSGSILVEWTPIKSSGSQVLSEPSKSLIPVNSSIERIIVPGGYRIFELF